MDFGIIINNIEVEHSDSILPPSATPTLDFIIPTKHKLYHVGAMDNGKQLSNIITASPMEGIAHIFCGASYSIYANKDYSKIWSAGYDRFGECCNGNNSDEYYKPIEYFRQNQIEIAKICVNINGACSFFITNNRQLYVSGLYGDPNPNPIWRNNEQEPLQKLTPTMIPELNNAIDAKSNMFYSIVLIKNHYEMTIRVWCRLYGIPGDISLLLLSFGIKRNRVYSATSNIGSVILKILH